jgi:hypothetical protein
MEPTERHAEEVVSVGAAVEERPFRVAKVEWTQYGL